MLSPAAEEEKTAEVMRQPQQGPHVIHMKAPARLTSGKKAVTEDRRGGEGEAPERASSLSLEDRLWARSCVQRRSGRAAAAIAAGREAMHTAVRGERPRGPRLPSRYLSVSSSIFLC